METQFCKLLGKWPQNACLHRGAPNVLILSKSGLSRSALFDMQSDFVLASGERLISVIFSLKMMHVYFRMGDQTFDYRPHRGKLSGINKAPYHCGKSDRVEVLLNLLPEELKRFVIYLQAICVSPRTILGRSFRFQLQEHDFTLKPHETRSLLTDNKLLDPNERHNCLSWFTTAPVGEDNTRFIELLKMTPADIDDECHSYIVAFYRFLLHKAAIDRVPGVIWWTEHPLRKCLNDLRAQPEIIRSFYNAKTYLEPSGAFS